MVEIRGSLIKGSVAAVKNRYGEQVYNGILSQLDKQSKQLFESPISDIAWYPLDIFAKFLEQDIKLTANGDEKALETRAEALHIDHMKVVYAGLTNSESPQAFLKHAAVLHQLYFKGVSLEIRFVGTNKAILRYTGLEKQHRILIPTIIGFYVAVLKTSGTKDIRTTYSILTENDKEYGELELLWA